jgi:hypothetical protein
MLFPYVVLLVPTLNFSHRLAFDRGAGSTRRSDCPREVLDQIRRLLCLVHVVAADEIGLRAVSTHSDNELVAPRL